jgi:exosortase/archaeosortase
MKYLRVGIPFSVVLACLLNGILAYSSDNGMAVMAYITALCGWVTIAWDEYLTYQRNKRIENVSDTIA